MLADISRNPAGDLMAVNRAILPTDRFIAGHAYSGDQGLLVVTTEAPVGGRYNAGIRVDDTGRTYVTDRAPLATDVSIGGFLLSEQGALIIQTAPAAGGRYIDGFRVLDNGRTMAVIQ